MNVAKFLNMKFFSSKTALIPFILLILNCNLMFGASVEVSEKMIQEYVTKIIDAEEARTKEKLDRRKILEQYSKTTTSSPYWEKDTYNHIAKVHVSLATKSNALSDDVNCDIKKYQKFLESIRKLSRHSYNPDSYKLFKNLNENGENYCNFNSYLICKHAPGSHGSHKCLCPETMIWQGIKCVFKLGEKCDDQWRIPYKEGAFGYETWEVDGSRFRNWDFLKHHYTEEIYPTCEGKSYCMPGSDVCEIEGSFTSYASVSEIASFLEKHFKAESPGSSDAAVTEAAREFLTNIDQPKNRESYYFFSLELLMEKMLLEHGAKCDADNEFEELMKKYNSRDNPHFRNYGKYNTYDGLRRKFQRKVLDSGLRICNHFKFLRCNSGKCDCKDNLEFNSKIALCTTSRHFDYQRNQMKLFRFRIVKYSAPIAYSSETIDSVYTYWFKIRTLQCASGTMPVKPATWLKEVCLQEEDFVTISNLQLEFDKKFSIETGGTCNPDDHKNLFNLISTSDYQAFQSSQKALQNLVDNPLVKYCKIRQRATCSKDGKCTCVPPTIQDSTDCKLNIHESCKTTGTKLEPHDEHKALDKLILPHETNIELQKLFCPSFALCHGHKKSWTSRLVYSCTHCLDAEKAGETCDLNPNPYVQHIDNNFLSLPASMQTIEGRKLIWELHNAMYKVEAGMTLKYGASCDSTLHAQLAEVMNFFLNVRKNCDCKWTMNDRGGGYRWKCDARECAVGTEFEKPAWDALLLSMKALISKSKPLCNWNQGLRCVDRKCECPADEFYEDGLCRVDMGADCDESDLYEHRPGYLQIKCRNRLSCYWKICQLDEVLVDNVKGHAYVDKIKSRLIQELILAQVGELQTLKDGEHCHHTQEEELKKFKLSADPVLEYAKTTGNLEEERRKIRQLEELEGNLKMLKSTGTGYCA